MVVNERIAQCIPFAIRLGRTNAPLRNPAQMSQSVCRAVPKSPLNYFA